MASLLIFKRLGTQKVGKRGGIDEEESKEGKGGRGKGTRKEEDEDISSSAMNSGKVSH